MSKHSLLFDPLSTEGGYNFTRGYVGRLEGKLTTQQRGRGDPTGSHVFQLHQNNTWPVGTKLLKILLVNGTNRVMQSHSFMTAELNTTVKAEVSKVSAVFLLKITFQLHIVFHPHHIFLKAITSTHMSRSPISKSSY